MDQLYPSWPRLSRPSRSWFRMAPKTWMPGTRPGMTWKQSHRNLVTAVSLRRRGDRPAREHADQVGAILGAAVNVARHAVGRHRHPFERFRAEALLQRLLERGHP